MTKITNDNNINGDIHIHLLRCERKNIRKDVDVVDDDDDVLNVVLRVLFVILTILCCTGNVFFCDLDVNVDVNVNIILI